MLREKWQGESKSLGMHIEAEVSMEVEAGERWSAEVKGLRACEYRYVLPAHVFWINVRNPLHFLGLWDSLHLCKKVSFFSSWGNVG